MTKELWLNLPVKNVAASKAFFEAIGFLFNEAQCNENMACLLVGSKKIVVMLFAEHLFKGFSQHNISDTTVASEMLISFDAASVKEVDEMATKVTAAGGNIFGKPSEVQGWMYGIGFTDLDGHRWNMLYMDMAKMKG